METITNSLAVIPFEKPEFGALVLLPDKVRAWKIETDNLKAAAEKFKTILPASFTNTPLAELDTFDTRLNSAIVKINEAFARIEKDRKGATSIIDEIKAYAMLPEKTLANYPAELKAFRDAIAKEKARRAADLERDKQKVIDKKNEAVQIRADQTNTINSNLSKLLASTIKAMNDKFNAQTLETLEGYVANTLTKYVPALSADAWTGLQKNGGIAYSHHSADEITSIYESLAKDLFQSVATEYYNKLLAERDRLIELAPSRLAELQAIKEDATKAQAAADRIAQEEADRVATAAKETQAKAEQVASSAQVEQMNNVFDVEATAESVTLAKGTQVKKKYTPSLPASWIPIIQSWVKNDLAQSTPEDLAKKLGFMLTAANKRLNSGEVLQGVTVEDDYSTRSTKVK